ncbi:MAG: Rab family GTPase [Promethearchaeota archaeon]
MTDNKDKFVFKIVVVGDAAVGKTSLIKKFTQGTFQEDYIQTIGAQLSSYQDDVNGDKIELFFWDIAGQDTFHFLRPAFYQGSRGAIVVYSIEDSNHGKKSFEHIDEWHEDIKIYCGDLPTVLLGNKVDLVDTKKLKEKKVLKLMKKRGFIGYYKTSAKTGDGVINAFQALIKELYNKYKGLMYQ